jgi:hypothetical protein
VNLGYLYGVPYLSLTFTNRKNHGACYVRLGRSGSTRPTDPTVMSAAALVTRGPSLSAPFPEGLYIPISYLPCVRSFSRSSGDTGALGVGYLWSRYVIHWSDRNLLRYARAKGSTSQACQVKLQGPLRPLLVSYSTNYYTM